MGAFTRRFSGCFLALFLWCCLCSGYAGASAHHTSKVQLRPDSFQVHPMYRMMAAAATDQVFNCQVANQCYGPKQIQAVYGLSPLFNSNFKGNGRTIVIIDAYQSPTILHDLQKFDQIFNLPNPKFHITAPDGLDSFDQSDPAQVGWAGEITLDVEWAHAMAPQANIELVLARSSSDDDILHATQVAIDKNLGDVITQSFGGNETCSDPNTLARQHQLFLEAAKKGITVLASTGDQGAAQLSCDGSNYVQAVSSPAIDPLVTAVGGTTLHANGLTGTYGSETVWNNGDSGSGGGYSTIFQRPSYQDGVVSNSHRGIADISAVADPNTGLLTIWSSSGSGKDLIFLFGGTSASSPQWAGILAVSDQVAHKRLGFINKALYIIGKNKQVVGSAFHDVTSGINGFKQVGQNGKVTAVVKGFAATKGWDVGTGWGTPKVSGLVSLLIKNVHDNDYLNI